MWRMTSAATVRQKETGKGGNHYRRGTGHLPLFLGYVGENLLDGCGVGGVFQSPSSEQIYNVAKEVEAGAGVLFLYGNYTGDIMNFDMAAEMLDMDDIRTASIVGADDVLSNKDAQVRRGVAGIFFMYKCAGARAARMGTLEEVLAAAKKAKDNTRTVGFALTPCVIPEIGHSKLLPLGQRTRWPLAWESTVSPECGTARLRQRMTWQRNPWGRYWEICP